MGNERGFEAMMVPTWWLVLSGLFFFMNIVLFGALAFAAIKLVGVAQGILPRVVTIEKQVSDLVKKVQDLTANIQQSVGELSGKAKGVAGSAEGIVQSASRQFERYSPFVIGSLTAIRLVAALNGVKKGRSLAKATSKKGVLQKKPKTLIGKVIKFVRR